MRITSISYRTGKRVSCFAYVATICISEYLNINETVIWFWIVSSECAKHLRLTLSSLAGLTSPTEGSRWVRSACEREREVTEWRGREGNPSLYALQVKLKQSSLLKRPHRRGASKLQLFLLWTTDISLDIFLFLSCSVFQLVCPVSSKGVLHAKRDLLKVNGNVS